MENILTPFNRTVKYLAKEIKELRGKEIDVNEAKDHNSKIYANCANEHTNIAEEIKQEAIDLYSRLMRAEEEKELARSEMINTMQFYSEERQKVLMASLIYTGDTLFDRGAFALLKKEYIVLSNTLTNLSHSFECKKFDDALKDDEKVSYSEGEEEDNNVTGAITDEILELFDY